MLVLYSKKKVVVVRVSIYCVLWLYYALVSNPYVALIEGVGGKGKRVDVGVGFYVGCLHLEVRTFFVFFFFFFKLCSQQFLIFFF